MFQYQDPNKNFKRIMIFFLLVIIIIVPFSVLYFQENKIIQNSQTLDAIQTNATISKKVETKIFPLHAFNISSFDAVIESEDGFVIVASLVSNKIVIFEIDYEGKTLWKKFLPANSNVNNVMLTQLPDTYLLSYKHRLSNEELVEHGNGRGSTIELNKYSHRIVNITSYAFTSAIATNKGYLAVGEYNYIYTLNKEGKPLWGKQYTKGRLDISQGQIKEIISTSDGNYLAVGSAVLGKSRRSSPWIFKFNSSGKIIWEQTLPSIYSSSKKVIHTDTGEYVIIGYHDAWKYSHDGKLLWYKDFSSNNVDFLIKIVRDLDKGYILAGGNKKGPLLMKISLKGDIRWIKGSSFFPQGSLRTLTTTKQNAIVFSIKSAWDFSYLILSSKEVDFSKINARVKELEQSINPQYYTEGR